MDGEWTRSNRMPWRGTAMKVEAGIRLLRRGVRWPASQAPSEKGKVPRIHKKEKEGGGQKRREEV